MPAENLILPIARTEMQKQSRTLATLCGKRYCTTCCNQNSIWFPSVAAILSPLIDSSFPLFNLLLLYHNFFLQPRTAADRFNANNQSFSLCNKTTVTRKAVKSKLLNMSQWKCHQLYAIVIGYQLHYYPQSIGPGLNYSLHLSKQLLRLHKQSHKHR